MVFEKNAEANTHNWIYDIEVVVGSRKSFGLKLSIP